MKIIGIIAEYNPFHLGHLYQINKIKEISKKEHQNSEILFKNQDTLDLDISVNSLENQIVRATMLKSKLYERKLEEKN